MGQSRLGATIAIRTSAFVLGVLTLAILLPCISAAQTNAVHAAAVAGPLPAAVVEPLKTYHDDSIRDIGAIGKRDVGCAHGPGSRYSLKAQVEMGRAYAQTVQAAAKLVTDPLITEYVSRIGQNLVRNSDAQVRVTFKVIAAQDVNAFSLPGGFIFVDSGLILAAENEAELAAVLSHEIAHVAACHGAQEIAGQQPTSFASMPLIFRLAARHIAMNTVSVTPVRSFEFDADLLAVEYLHKAGYDPQALPTFFEKVRVIQQQKTGSRGRTFEWDDQITDRIQRSRQEIHTLLPPAPEYKLDTSDFHEMQARLVKLESARR